MTTAVMSKPETRNVDYSSLDAEPPAVRHELSGSLSRFLGYFSLGLGLAEALAPRAIAQVTGVDQQELLQAYGVREFVTGIGILSSDWPTGWLWARVAGDALDLLTLGNSLGAADAPKRSRVLASLLAVAGVTALDVVCAACYSSRRTGG